MMITFDIAFDDGGFDDLNKKLQEVARKTAIERIKSIRCPEHGTSAKVKKSSTKFTCETCCDKLGEKIKKAFGN